MRDPVTQAALRVRRRQVAAIAAISSPKPAVTKLIPQPRMVSPVRAAEAGPKRLSMLEGASADT